MTKYERQVNIFKKLLDRKGRDITAIPNDIFLYFSMDVWMEAFYQLEMLDEVYSMNHEWESQTI